MLKLCLKFGESSFDMLSSIFQPIFSASQTKIRSKSSQKLCNTINHLIWQTSRGPCQIYASASGFFHKSLLKDFNLIVEKDYLWKMYKIFLSKHVTS